MIVENCTRLRSVTPKLGVLAKCIFLNITFSAISVEGVCVVLGGGGGGG